MDEENKIIDLKLEDLTVEGSSGQLLAVNASGGLSWQNPEFEITPYECRVRDHLTVNGIDVMQKIEEVEQKTNLVGGEGLAVTKWGNDTTLQVCPTLLGRIAELEAMVHNLAAQVEENKKAQPYVRDPEDEAHIQNEIAKRAEEQAQYDEYLKSHYETLETEDPNKAYERAMGIIE